MTMTLTGRGTETSEILVSPEWLQAEAATRRICILDATVDLPKPRFDGDYRPGSGFEGWRAGHIPGSRHADLLTDLAQPDPLTCFAHPDPAILARRLAALGVDEDGTTVVYDRGDGLWAARLWWMLHSLGISARVLDGGWKAWLAAGLPHAVGDEAAPAPGRVTARGERNFWVDRHAVKAVMDGEDSGTLICALSAEQFRGVAPTRYKRRGHIPGSLNLPARSLLAADGRFKDKAGLAAVVDPVISGRPRPLVLYCGGGISATVPALALTLLGHDDVVIYDGSLQEWAAILDLPLVTDDDAADGASAGAAS